MFRRLPDAECVMIEVTVDGRPERVRDGDTVAAALVSLGMGANRVSDVSGAPRGPYCMMGVCFECLVTIDGVGNRQGCLIPVQAGMRIECQTTRRGIDR
jgi:predicted molibdopterin-dependent oxidoreductase YjgC